MPTGVESSPRGGQAFLDLGSELLLGTVGGGVYRRQGGGWAGLLDRLDGWQRIYADDEAVVHIRKPGAPADFKIKPEGARP